MENRIELGRPVFRLFQWFKQDMKVAQTQPVTVEMVRN